jgi:hypothetical protein
MLAAISFVGALLLLSDAGGFWPYDLNLLRWAVSGCATIMLIGGQRDSFQWLLILLAILAVFNPLIPVRLPPGSLPGVEVIASICFVAAGFALND